MAIRVKKLARELRCRPEQVLSALSILGFDRYRSPMDMLPDRPADEVRRMARRGRLPEVEAPRKQPPQPARAPAPPPEDDVMARLVPGVVPQRGADAQPRSPLDTPLDQVVDSAGAQGTPTDAVTEAASEAARAIRDEEARQQARARDLAARARELEAEAAQLREEGAALRAQRDALQAEIDRARQALDDRARALDALEAGGTPVARLLEERGLRGADEQGRALSALARARLLDPLLERLRVVDPAPVRALLRDRLLLVGGPVPDLDGPATVVVPEDRADIPGGSGLARLRDDLFGELLLSGLRRVRIVGGPPALLRLLRDGVDPRIDLDVVPGRRREADVARHDVAGRDAVLLWQVTPTPDARSVYDAADAVVIGIETPTLAGLLAGVRAGLRED